MHILTTIGRDRFGFVVVAALPAPLAPTISSVNQLAIFSGPNELVPPIFFCHAEKLSLSRSMKFA
jgi:hypothetical protein